MRILSEGMAGMTHDNDVRVAEGLRDLELPADPARPWPDGGRSSMTPWSSGTGPPAATSLISTGWSSRVITLPINFCFPHYFLLPTYSSASSYRIRPLGPEETLFELWSLTRYPAGSASRPSHHRAGAHGAGRSDDGHPFRPRTTRTCPDSRKACTPRASSTCDSPTRSKA